MDLWRVNLDDQIVERIEDEVWMSLLKASGKKKSLGQFQWACCCCVTMCRRHSWRWRRRLNLSEVQGPDDQSALEVPLQWQGVSRCHQHPSRACQSRTSGGGTKGVGWPHAGGICSWVVVPPPRPALSWRSLTTTSFCRTHPLGFSSPHRTALFWRRKTCPWLMWARPTWTRANPAWKPLPVFQSFLLPKCRWFRIRRKGSPPLSAL